ncbi:hypothetical protein ACI2JA_11005 [Alkalihalobacillus sp. NPDC078783]
MEAILATIYSTIILIMTVYFIVKMLNIAYKRNEITIRKFILIATASITIGITLSVLSLYMYQTLFGLLL